MTIQQDHDARALDNIYERNKARIREIDAVLDELRPLLAKLGREREECIAITREREECIAITQRSEHPPTLSYGVLGEMAQVAASAFENAMTANATSDPARDLGKVAGRAEAHKY